MTIKTFVRLSACSLLVSFFFVAQKASSLPFWDSANYTVGANLSGLVNPEGNAWAPMAVGAQTVDVQIESYPLSYPGLECSDLKAFEFGDSGTQGYTDRVAIHPPIFGENTLYTNASGSGSAGITNVLTNTYIMTNGTIYYSFVFTVTELAGLPTTGGFVCGFNTLVGSQDSQPTVIGSRLYMELNGSGYQVGIGKNPTGPTLATYLPTVLAVNSVNFVVCSYTIVPGASGSNDIAQIWLNPPSSTFGAVVPPVPNAMNTSGGGLISGSSPQLESFLFREGNSAIPLMYVSDLRIGYCWACVTPPSPNPAPQAATLSIATGGTPTNVVSFRTNTPCFLLTTTTNVTNVNNAWYPVVDNGTNTVGANFVVTNTVPSSRIVTSNVVGNVTNYSTNFYTNAYYQVKTYAN